MIFENIIPRQGLDVLALAALWRSASISSCVEALVAEVPSTLTLEGFAAAAAISSGVKVPSALGIKTASQILEHNQR